MRYVILLALLGLACAKPKNQKRYDGYMVWSITPTTQEDLALLHSWSNLYDFWKEPTQVGREVHLMVSPLQQTTVRAKLLAANIPHSVHIADVQRQIDVNWAEIDALRARRPDTMVFDYNNYNTYADTLAELVNLATNFCPAGHTCTTKDIGTTYENRVLRVLEVKVNNPPSPHYAYWYDSQIHAREWLAGATLMQVVRRIMTGTDADAVHFRDTYDWYFLPIYNPDGYDWTWNASGDRLWRKNRYPSQRNLQCIGTDLNRNHDYNWQDEGSSNKTCSETYCGDSPASELETKAIDAYAAQIKSNLVTWTNFHTYGQYWLSPYGDCTTPPDHTSHQMTVINPTCTAIENTYNTRWACGNSCSVLYATSGGVIDRMKGTHNIRYAHVPELRGNSFIVPVDQIPLSYNEIWNGLVAFVFNAEQNGYP